MRLLDLFSGIGGFSLGLERAGFRTVAFCEIEPYPRAVLAKHWPGVPIYDDVRTLSADTLRRDGIAVDAICGGFPCQDLSFAGKRAGIEGARSGLWSEYARIIGEIRPRVAIMENVPGLLSAGHGRVLGDLVALGYDAWWDCIPASALCAPHRRDRVWIVAHAAGERRGEKGRDRERSSEWIASGGEVLAHAPSIGQQAARNGQGHPAQNGDGQASRPRSNGEGVADADNTGLEGRQRASLSERPGKRVVGAGGTPIRNAARELPYGSWKRAEQGQRTKFADTSGRQPERGLGGMVDGLSDWVDASAWLQEPENVPRVIKGQENRAHRLKGLGNAVVPQVVEVIGRAVMEGLHAV